MEEKIDAEYLKKLAHQLMFDLSDDEAAALEQEFHTLLKQMSFLDKVNTDGVVSA